MLLPLLIDSLALSIPCVYVCVCPSPFNDITFLIQCRTCALDFYRDSERERDVFRESFHHLHYSAHQTSPPTSEERSLLGMGTDEMEG